MTRNTQKTLGIATGFKGSLGDDWDYEALVNHSQYDADVRYPRVIAEAANDLLLGPQAGVDDYGYAIYNARSGQFLPAVDPRGIRFDHCGLRLQARRRAAIPHRSRVSKADLFELPPDRWDSLAWWNTARSPITSTLIRTR